MNDALLEMRDITRDFPGVRALDGVTFEVRRGTIHALVGENGAGKSTLIQVLGGVHPHGTYGGVIRLDGREQHFAGVRDAERAGIAVIHQELALVRPLSVAENVFLGAERLRFPGVVDWPRTYREAAAATARVGLRASPATRVSELGVGEQQMVEIARALARNARLLVLDEPSAALTESETETLLGILAELRARGVTCIYISHRLGEVRRIADRVTVLRDGRTVCSDEVAAMPVERLVRSMVGRDLAHMYPHRERTPGAPVLAVRGWTVTDPADGRVAVREASFTVRRGEILGLAGLMGAGRTELVMSLLGAWGRRTAGSLALDGRALDVRDPRAAIAHGLALVTEDRKRYGLVMGLSVQQNASLAILRRIARAGVLDHRAESRLAGIVVRELRTRTPSLDTPVRHLSGGNQQKVLIARGLLTEPRVLFLDEPTRGIDVGAKVEVYDILNDLVDRGVCVVIVSSELPEVLGMSDRVLVMREGRIVAELPREQADEERVMSYATGAQAPMVRGGDR
jgi:ABC-type sugar transport system ATPase subunit